MIQTDHQVTGWVNECDRWTAAEGGDPSRVARMTKELYPYDAMFSPIRINRMTVKNRLVMAPMGNIDMCEETGRPDQRMLDYFFARAKGGVGLITTGLVPVSHGIDHSITELDKLTYFPRIDRSRTVYAGWRDLAQGCHAFGTKIFLQLTAGLGRVGNPQCLITELKFPGSASLNPNFYMPEVPCLRLSDRKLGHIVKNTGQAAADAMACGLDGVYLHGHEGYLLEQMTNPAFNRRVLGKYADWKRFGLDLVREIRRRCGDAYPIMYRIDLSLALNETYGEAGMKTKALRKFRNGRTVAMTLDYMKDLVAAGVDLFDVDLGCYDNWWLPHPPSSMPAGCYLGVSETVKRAFEEQGIRSNAGQPVPVVAVGKLGYPDLAERALRDGKADMIMLGRPLLADPEWPNKAYAGRVEEICPCIGCQEGCLNEFVDGGHPQCAVNPRTAFEGQFPEHPAPAHRVKNIAVIGAGPAGVICAVTAAQRGHRVELIERSDRVGGKIYAGSRAKAKFDLENYREYLERLLHTAQDGGNLTLRFGTQATAEILRKGNYDAIVFASGTAPLRIPFPGLETVRSVQAEDLLCDPSLLGDAKNAVIVGGGAVGCETAQWLKYEKNTDCTVVEMSPWILDGVCTANRGHLIHLLKQAGVPLLNCAKVTGFEPGCVKIERNISKGVPDAYNTWQPILPKNIVNPLAKKPGPETEVQTLKTDLVVLAMGGRPDTDLFCAAQKERLAPELHNIGDSFAGGRVLEAVRAAYRLAVTL